MDKPENEDPFVVSDTVNKQYELAVGFKKNKEASSDVIVVLDELEVTKLTTNAIAESMFIGAKGFKDDFHIFVISPTFSVNYIQLKNYRQIINKLQGNFLNTWK